MLLLAVCLTVFFKGFSCTTWNYDTSGPSSWFNLYSSCAGYWQSPLNINTSNTFYDQTLTPIQFNNYNLSLTWILSNNGYSTILEPSTSNNTTIPYLSGSNFGSNQYYLTQVVFHWGYNDYQGSEHMLNYLKYPLEMQLYHKTTSGSVSAVAFLFQLSSSNNSNMDNLLDLVSFETIFNFTLQSIFPSSNAMNSSGYYRYYGSITTPPCTEGVTWSVYSNLINISSNQLAVLRNSTGAMTNFRSIQNTYYRSIYTGVLAANTTARTLLTKNNAVAFHFQFTLIMSMIILLKYILLIEL